jgi:hypothetical protein
MCSHCVASRMNSLGSRPILQYTDAGGEKGDRSNIYCVPVGQIVVGRNN